MTTALYYPYAQITNETVLKTGLILWDKLEFISPWREFEQKADSPEHARINELIVRPYLANDQIKKIVHEQVRQLVESGLPDWFWVIPEDPKCQYQMYPRKMMEKTWQLLLDASFVRVIPRSLEEQSEREIEHEYTMSPAIGMSLMSVLADTIAGHQKKLITDVPDSYASLNRFITRAKRGHIEGLEQTDAEREVFADSGFGKLVSVSMSVLNIDNIEIDKLIEMREREYKSNDTLLQELRRSYFARLDSVTQKIASEVEHEGDFNEILSSFYSEMEADLTNLKRELKLDAKNALLSKEVVASFLTPPTATLVNPVAGVITGFASILGVTKALGDYREARRKTLKQHPMAWLYMNKPSHIFG